MLHEINIIICLFLLTRAEFPNYLQKCSLSDKNINECLTKQANLAVKNILHGDKNLGIPELNPYRLPNFTTQNNQELFFSLTNCLESDMGFFEIKSVELNLETNILDVVGVENQSYRQCNYKILGTLGNGNFSDTGLLKLIGSGQYVLYYTAIIDILDIDGNSYYQIINGTSRFTSDTPLTYEFSKPNGGDDSQAKELTIIVNTDNKITRKILPNFKTVTDAFCKDIINYILKSTPANELFDP